MDSSQEEDRAAGGQVAEPGAGAGEGAGAGAGAGEGAGAGGVEEGGEARLGGWREEREEREAALHCIQLTADRRLATQHWQSVSEPFRLMSVEMLCQLSN